MWSQWVDGRTWQSWQTLSLARISARMRAHPEGSLAFLLDEDQPPLTTASYSSGMRSVSLPSAHPLKPVRRLVGLFVVATP